MEEPQSASREPAQPVAVVGLASMTAAVAQVIGSARNELAILSCRLEPALYSDSSVVDAVHELALRHDRVRIRILVNDPDSAMRRAHRLVEFARRLTSRIEFRELSEENRGIIDDCVIADERAVWLRERPDALESRLYADAPLEARSQRRRFDPLWEMSAVARAFSALGI